MKKYIMDFGKFYNSYLEIENNELINFSIEEVNNLPKIGEIYFGIITNILPKLEYMFVDIGKKNNAILHFKDTLKYRNFKEDEIYEGKRILVQIKKEEDEKKGAKVSEVVDISVGSVVYLPYEKFKGISKKINAKDKNRILNILNKYEEDGFIVRSYAKYFTDEEIECDIKKAKENWNDILGKIKNLKKVSLIYSVDKKLEDIIFKLKQNEIDELILNSEEKYIKILKILSELDVKLEKKIKLYNKKNLFKREGIEFILKNLLLKKVPLKGGGNIIIEETETLTAIDVNSEKAFKGDKKNILDFNLIAFKEVIRQIEFRNISGIIIIDALKFKNGRNREKFIELIKDICKNSENIKYHSYTKLGLIELTRKNNGLSIFKLLKRDSGEDSLKYSLEKMFKELLEEIYEHNYKKLILIVNKKYENNKIEIERFLSENFNIDIVLKYEYMDKFYRISTNFEEI